MGLKKLVEKIMPLNVPFKWVAPFFYLAWFSSWLLFLLFSPVLLLYNLVLCALCWFFWWKPDRNVLFIHDGGICSDESALRIQLLVKGRSVTLDYSQRKSWPYWSFTTQLFNCFGPHPIPERFMPQCLPTVIVFRRFRWPKKFTLGLFAMRSPRFEENFEEMQIELKKP